MNFVATRPVIPPLASGPWHGTQNVTYRSRPIAMDASVALTGFGRLAATSRWSFGTINSPSRGTTPGGIGNTRSPGTILAVCVMSSFQRTTIAAPHAPAAAPTTRSIRMKTYFMGAGASRQALTEGGLTWQRRGPTRPFSSDAFRHRDFTSSAPAGRRSSCTEPARSGAQLTAHPKRSVGNRGTYGGLRLKRGDGPR